MKKIFEIALGIVTAIGGFLEIGSMTTAAQGGAEYRFQLLWAIVLGGICVAFLIEMSGRFSAVSKHSIIDAIRERFGFVFFLILFITVGCVTLLVLGAEIGGICVAMQFVTGIAFQWWAVPVVFVLWLLLWKETFEFIEKAVSILGLVTLVFIVASIKLKPDWRAVADGLIPSLPAHDAARYWFIVVSILGASITPYLMFFYSSGAIEDGWTKKDLFINRVVAAGGMGFGSFVSMSVLVVAAMVLLPAGIRVEHFNQLPLMLTPVFGYWGFVLFAASLGVACMGAALEITLQMAFMVAQGFGWNWEENARPKDESRFCLTYTVILPLATLLVIGGVDPLKLTILSMALTSATLPIAILPFIVLMNDRRYLGKYTNGWISNAVVLFTCLLACVLAVITIPLQFLGS